MAKEWAIEGLTPDLSFRQAAARIITTKSAEMWSYAPGTILGADIEQLHSMRVSSRRLRAAVDVSAPCFPRKTFARYQAVIASLTDALGSVRDADVMLEFLNAERARVQPAEQAGLDDLIALVTEQRAAQRPAMQAALEALAGGSFREHFEAFIAGADAPGQGEAE